jgi:hypothetical protein
VIVKWLLLVLVATLVTECGGSPLTIAVDNRDEVAYLLRIIGGGGSRAWLVPPHSVGLGPTISGEDRPFELLVTLDCTEQARFALVGGRQTLVVWGHDMAPSSQDGIANGLAALAQVADPCPL